ncbi:AraC family transcriptional regulator [Chitinophaga nivalis]|uniref:AraC family transcriptional regulator n=1 Tax=Chitinophaga nivalis TaxID=2991709 RepID=A0ABT3INC5_9BACT|nr:AraC family transcriptional regulator [Chitinophaga nivalis]MCW3464838.1 AraC family transcriptional regulator [Chitinophaga nivalis]MCW3485471.1 AraC family transcriptional regulator [Chitinophaga nivalis]
MDRAKFCHLTVDEVEKDAYVWHEAQWKFGEEWHAHQKGQLIYVEQGFQYLHTEQKKYLLPTHHCAWIPPGLPHRTSSPEAAVFLRCTFFKTTPGHAFYDEINIFHTPRVLREMILHTARYSRLKAEDPVEADFLQAILSSLPVMCQASVPLMIPVPQDQRLVQLADEMAGNLDEPFNLRQLAAKHTFSARTLERLFKKDIGMSPVSYIKLLRMIKAVELLSRPEENVSSVAYKVGYNSIPTFSNTFKQVIGLRPQDMFK